MENELSIALWEEELFQMLYSENKKRGFTLVELIVVLVILAILAALLIPALTGYIDKAKKDQVIAETRMLHEAVQTEMVEIYGSNTNWKPAATNDHVHTTYKANTLASKDGQPVTATTFVLPDAQDRYNEIVKLSEVPSLQDGSGHFFALVTSSAKVHALIYNSGRGYIGVYFRDTNQYTAYKLNEQSAGGTVTLDSFTTYMDCLYYNSATDSDIFDPYHDITLSMWSCSGIRGMLNIESNVFNSY